MIDAFASKVSANLINYQFVKCTSHALLVCDMDEDQEYARWFVFCHVHLTHVVVHWAIGTIEFQLTTDILTRIKVAVYDCRDFG